MHCNLLPREPAADFEQHLRIAATKSRLAKFALAEFLLQENKEVSRAVELLCSAASDGLGYAATVLGILSRSGIGVAKDIDVSNSWFEKGARLGDPAGWTWLAMNYVSDLGAITDKDAAKRLFSRAVDEGDFAAYSWLAVIYLESKDPNERNLAVDLLRRGAEVGDYGSLTRLAKLYRQGTHGVPKDVARAEEYEQKVRHITGTP